MIHLTSSLEPRWAEEGAVTLALNVRMGLRGFARSLGLLGYAQGIDRDLQHRKHLAGLNDGKVDNRA
jgi:hypothetical protein